MSEFKISGDSNLDFRDGGEFSLVVESYADVNVTRVINLDYLGQTTRPQRVGVAGGINEVVLRFNANYRRGVGEVDLCQSGTSYETNMQVDELHYKVHIHVGR